MQDCALEALLDALCRLLQEENLTQRILARRLGFSEAHLSLVLARKRRPGLRFLRAAAQFPAVRRILEAELGPERPPRNDSRR